MAEVNASIITVGDELLIGQTTDTNSVFIAGQLNAIGIWVKRKYTVGDDEDEIIHALNREWQDCSIIIITGGLGPTADDITKNALCRYFDSELVRNEEALENIRSIFSRYNRPLTNRNTGQADVPHNCTVLQNRRGTAPGMLFEKEGHIVISLPGVPHEMMGLMTDSVLQALIARFSLPVIRHNTLLTAGVGESVIADHLQQFESSLPSRIKLAYLPSYGLVKLRLTGRGDNEKELTESLAIHFAQLQELTSSWLVAAGDISLQQAVVDRLKSTGKTLATAESCTGGYIAHLITTVPGASACYMGSVIAYANEVKAELLDVKEKTIRDEGAVSESTVSEMVLSARRKMNADYAIATSGIMGPSGGTQEKPVGTVWIAVTDGIRLNIKRHFFRFDRMRNIELTAQAALGMLFRMIRDEKA